MFVRSRSFARKSIACDILHRAVHSIAMLLTWVWLMHILSILDERTNEISLATFTYDNYYLRKMTAAKKNVCSKDGNPFSHLPRKIDSFFRLNSRCRSGISECKQWQMIKRTFAGTLIDFITFYSLCHHFGACARAAYLWSGRERYAITQNPNK